MIKDALSSLPARPALVIAPVIVALVLAFYYWERYSSCTDMQRQRTALNGFLASVAAPATFRLVDFTDFSWDQVRVVVKLQPESRTVDCPFGWNWPEGERESLIDSELITGMIFGREGTIVRYLELRADEVAIDGVESVLTPETAVFSVDRKSNADRAVMLILAP